MEAFFHLTCFMLHLFMLALVLMLFPAMYIKCTSGATSSTWQGVFDLSVFTLATMLASVFYMASQLELFGNGLTALKYFPVLMALGVGMSVSNAKAVLEAVTGKKSEFVRTPKYGDKGVVTGEEVVLPRRKRTVLLPYVEFALGLYMVGCATWSVIDLRAAPTTPFLAIFAFGFFYVSIMSFLAQREAHLASTKAQELRVGVKRD